MQLSAFGVQPCKNLSTAELLHSHLQSVHTTTIATIRLALNVIAVKEE